MFSIISINGNKRSGAFNLSCSINQNIMGRIMKQIYKFAILILTGLNLVRTLYKVNLTVATFIAAVIVVLSGITLMGKNFKMVTLTFISLGLFTLIKFRLPLIVWMESFNSMTNVIAILVVMQLFTIPIEVGKYNLAIRYQLNRSLKGEGELFLFTTFATHIFTSFLMFGAIPVMITLMEDTLKRQVSNYERFMSTATSRGYALASLWAPGAVNLFLVVQVTGVSWAKIFFPGLFLGLLGIMLSYFFESRRNFSAVHQIGLNLSEEGISIQEEKQIRKKVWHIVAVVVALSTLTMLLAQLKLGSSSSTVILAGALVALFWILLFRQEEELKATLHKYWDYGIFKAADIAPFFIAIGIFSNALQRSGLNNLIESSLRGYAHNLGFFAIVLIPLTMIILAVLGIHPFVSIVMLGQILTSLHLPLPSETVALCLALGGSISYMVSPFAGVIMAIAKLVNAKAEDVALRWNWSFCTAYFSLGIILAYFWGNILG